MVYFERVEFWHRTGSGQLKDRIRKLLAEEPVNGPGDRHRTRHIVTGAARRQQKAPNQEVLAGLVERVTFHNADNGFCVLRIKARGHRDL